MASAIITQPATLAPRLLADGSYMVDSRTQTLVAYKVRKLEHGWECNCEAAAHYRPCWHLMEVLALEAASEDLDLAVDLAAISEYLEEEAPRTSVAKRAGITLESLFAQ